MEKNCGPSTPSIKLRTSTSTLLSINTLRMTASQSVLVARRNALVGFFDGSQFERVAVGILILTGIVVLGSL